MSDNENPFAYNPTEDEALEAFMRLGCPEGRPAYFDLPGDTIVFERPGETLCAAEIRLVQAFIRRKGFRGGRSRLDDLADLLEPRSNA